MAQFNDEPNMSDATLLLSVEDLINRALGSPDGNAVNFKLIQMILQILARQLRLLEQRVEIRIAEFEAPRFTKTTKKEREISESSSSKSPRSPTKRKMADIKEEREPKKDKEKVDKKEEKEKEKSDKKGGKEKEKADKKTEKEKEKLEKVQQKEQEKAKKEEERAKKGEEKAKRDLEKAAKKEKEKAEKERKQAEKERARADKEREKSPRGVKKARVVSASSIAITEVEKDREKVLVVEKGPTTRAESRGKVGIDVVTQSQFALLEAAVNDLKDVALPKPLVLPDNEKLKSDLARGSATLPDTMQAMQVNARVNAAEDTIKRMTGILTALAVSGELPEDLLSKLDEISIEGEKPSESAKSRPRKSVGIDPKASQASSARPSAVSAPSIRPSSVSTPVTPKASQATTAASRGSFVSKASSMSVGPGVTRDEMDAALKELREDLSKNLNNMTNKANNIAENALHTAKTIADRLDVALKLDLRISTLYSLVGDYAEQLSGFDAGLTTQMKSFQDQMAQIRADLKGGLDQLDNVNNNAETAAVMELTERYQDLATELDTTLHAHKGLTNLQSELGGEMHSLVECVEMLREQKSDRDEVLDGLRDKADTTRLAGLLTEVEFAKARADFERRIEVCHDKFQRQEAVWMAAIKDLKNITDNKAELMDLLSARYEAEKQLQELHEKIRILATVLGEPKAALLTRKLAVNATCGSCKIPALMEPKDAVAGAPFSLPALRPPPVGAPNIPCFIDWIGAEPPSDKHICHRWCGGSHTLITETTTKERATPMKFHTVPSNKYSGYGDDGRLYLMEEELKPCLECNLLSADVHPSEADVPERGAGDTAEDPGVCTCVPSETKLDRIREA